MNKRHITDDVQRHIAVERDPPSVPYHVVHSLLWDGHREPQGNPNDHLAHSLLGGALGTQRKPIKL